MTKVNECYCDACAWNLRAEHKCCNNFITIGDDGNCKSWEKPQ